MVQLTDEQRGAVDELIVEAQKMAVISDNFAETIRMKGAEEHADALIRQAGVVRGILSRLPQPTSVWDGKLYDEHLVIEKFDVPAGTPRNRGARVRHMITGIGRESSSKNSFEENHAVARRALEQAVNAEYHRLYD